MFIFIVCQTKVVCYYTSWSQYRVDPARFKPENIDSNLCDVIIYAFGNIRNNALTTLDVNDDGITAIELFLLLLKYNF